MKKIYLHIGTHKTGSTAIQMFMARNRRALRESGIHYLENGCPDLKAVAYGHHLLPWSVQNRKNVAMAIWKPVLNEINQSPSDQIVISSEEFDRLTDEQIEILGTKLPVKPLIVVYLRRQEDLIESLYATEVVYSGRQTHFSEFMHDCGIRLDYDEMLSAWERISVPNSLVVKRYDRRLFINNNVVADFLSILPVSSALRVNALEVEANKSLPRAAVLAVKHLWKLDLGAAQTYRAIEALEKVYRNRRTKLDIISPSQRLEVIERYGASNRRVKERYFDSFDGPLFEETTPETQEDWFNRNGKDRSELRQLIRDLTSYINSSA